MKPKTTQWIAFVLVALFSLHNGCLCHTPNQGSDSPETLDDPYLVDFKIVPQGLTVLQGDQRDIQFSVETTPKHAKIDRSKLKLKIWKDVKAARLFYQGKEVGDEISCADLPPFGQLVNLRLEPGQAHYVRLTMQIGHVPAPTSAGDTQQFIWYDDQGIALLKTIQALHDFGWEEYGYHLYSKADAAQLLTATQEVIEGLSNPETRQYLYQVGDNVLLDAIEHKLMDRVEMLLKHGANVDAPNKDGTTPLMEAVLSPNKALAQLLLKYKANTNAADREGNTPLMYATYLDLESAYTELIQLLIDHGAKVNHADLKGWTPLLWAINARSKNNVALLIKYQADVNKSDNSNRTPLFVAVKATKGNKEIVQLLLANGAQTSINQADTNGETPLWAAVAQGYDEIAALLVAAGADVDYKKDGKPIRQLIQEKDMPLTQDAMK